MKRTPLGDLATFAVVARERSFTAAARRLEVSTSALSHAMRTLEAQLGIRLLARTTRSVAPTEAGQRLLARLDPALAEIDAALAGLRDAQASPAATLRITAVKHAVETVVLPMLPAFAARFPDIRLEIDVDDGLTDLVAEGYDAGIRFAGRIEGDMIAVPIGPSLAGAVVASPLYLNGRSAPRTPADLAAHRCIVHRRGDGSAYPWPLREGGAERSLQVDATIGFNDSDLVCAAAIAGLGIACIFEDRAAPWISSGRLVNLLEDCRVPFAGYALYHLGRRQSPVALACFIDALRAAHRDPPAA